MYLIINISKPPKEVSLSDLNFVLGKNKAVDLEKVFKKSDIENSKDLLRAEKKGLIQIRHSNKKEKENIQQSVSDSEIQKIRDTIKQEIQEALGDKNKENTDLKETIAALKEIINSKKKENIVNLREQPQRIQKKEDDDDLDMETLSKIHAKAIKNKSNKGVSSKLEYEEQREKSDISDALKDLEDLIE